MYHRSPRGRDTIQLVSWRIVRSACSRPGWTVRGPSTYGHRDPRAQAGRQEDAQGLLERRRQHLRRARPTSAAARHGHRGAARSQEEPLLRARRGHRLGRLPGRQAASGASPRRSIASTSSGTRTTPASSASSTPSTTPRSPTRCSPRPSSWAKAQGHEAHARAVLALASTRRSGCLVEGFDTPPMVMMPHHRALPGRAHRAGRVRQAQGLLRLAYDVGEVPTRARRRRTTRFAAMPEVTDAHRRLRRRCSTRRRASLMDIFNDAWSENWGFVPLTENELVKMADGHQADPRCRRSRASSSSTGSRRRWPSRCPNINELIARPPRQALPASASVKLLWRLERAGAEERAPGHPRHPQEVAPRAQVRRALAPTSTWQMNDSAHLLGMKCGELGWTLEDNAAINAGIRLMGGRI